MIDRRIGCSDKIAQLYKLRHNQ